MLTSFRTCLRSHPDPSFSCLAAEPCCGNLLPRKLLFSSLEIKFCIHVSASSAWTDRPSVLSIYLRKPSTTITPTENLAGKVRSLWHTVLHGSRTVRPFTAYQKLDKTTAFRPCGESISLFHPWRWHMHLKFSQPSPAAVQKWSSTLRWFTNVYVDSITNNIRNHTH